MGLVFLIITMVISLLGVLQNTRKNVWQRLIILALVVTVALALYFMVNNLDLGEEVTQTDRTLEMLFLVLFSVTVVGAGVYATLIGIKLENSLEPVER
jgi:disulfide bond formation protein DsbB